jgi:hypothetical protein
MPYSRRLATRFAGGDPINVRAGDANVSQFTIGQVRKFAPHRLVMPPGLISADEGSKHGIVALSPAMHRNAAALFVFRPSVIRVDAAITREWIAHQMVCLSPLNNSDIRWRAD